MAAPNDAALQSTSINTKISVEETRSETPERKAYVNASLDTGWAWVVAMGSLCSTVIIGGHWFSMGIMQLALLETYHQSVTKTAWVGAVFSGLGLFIAPLAAMLINYTSCRTTMIIGSILATVGFSISSVVRDFDLLMFTCGIMAGTGVGISYTTGVVVIGYNFDRKRNLASGIVGIGSGVGKFLMPLLWQTLLDKYSLPGTFLLLGGISFNMCVAGALYIPSQLELKFKASPSCQRGVIRSVPSSSTCKSFCFLLNGPFVLLCFSILLWSTGIGGIYIHLPSYAISNGFSDSSTLLIISVMGIANIPGRLLTGIAATSNDVDELVLYGGTLGLTGIATILLPLVAKHYAGFMVYAFVFGFYSGGVYAILLTITTFLVGIDNLSGAFAAVTFFGGIGFLIGPSLAGIVYEGSGSFEYSFFFVGTCILLGGLLGMFTKLGSSRVSDANVDRNVCTQTHVPPSDSV